ncbi:arylsulfatase [Vagococcus lutrae]|uniref:sulfatase family protein n=1 Tax=Vagococcus lutrae TaxID=81947 RepID=UPI00200E2EC9|nr:arylsulfatase [Vagococcus lutrae]UQF38098.1 arylsulfatase [Vagococcus lutrae]
MQKKPNVILIFVDDVGIGDLSCFNSHSKIQTAQLDRLAERGMRFEDSHSISALCTPSRYGLLTGTYSWRSPLKSYVLPGDSLPLIEEGRRTMAQMFKEKGYQTAVVGKWHLGLGWQLKPEKDFEKFNLDPSDYGQPKRQMGRAGDFNILSGMYDMEGLDIDYSQPIKDGPLARGFDYFYGTPASIDQPPYVVIENDRVLEEPTYISGRANIDRRSGVHQQEWQNGVTAPSYDHTALPRQMQDKVLELMESYSQSDAPFFIYYPVHIAHGPILPDEPFVDSSGIGPYGDIILQLDSYVGEIQDKLVELGADEDTLVVFTSDNGASAVADFPHLLAHGHNPSAHFRGEKFDIWEGGHREPTIMTYPNYIPANSVCQSLVAHTDFYRTFADLIGYDIYHDEAVDSESMLDMLKEPNQYGRVNLIVTSANGAFSIRKGPWKLECTADEGSKIPEINDPEAFQPSQLYHLESDPWEHHNVIEGHPEIVSMLIKEMTQIVKKGRSTPGPIQRNAANPPTYEWHQLAWMPNYEDYVEQLNQTYQEE